MKSFYSGERRRGVRQMIDVSKEHTSTKFHHLLLLGLSCGPENRRYVAPKRRLTSPNYKASRSRQLYSPQKSILIFSAISIRNITRSDNVWRYIQASHRDAYVNMQWCIHYFCQILIKTQEAKLKRSLCLFTNSLYSSMFLNLSTLWSGQLQVMAALPPWKEPNVPIG